MIIKNERKKERKKEKNTNHNYNIYGERSEKCNYYETSIIP
jgi:hypothetical protein